MIYGAYFSPTENTKNIVRYFSNASKEIDLMNPPKVVSFSEDDILYLGVPSFGGRAPLLAVERLKAFKGNNTKAIIIASYGNRACEDTLIELADLLKSLGFIVIAGLEVVMPHSIFPNIAKNRPDSLDIKELALFRERINSKLEATINIEAIIPGNHPYKERNPKGPVPVLTSRCTGCKRCVSICPVGAIDFKSLACDATKCIHCMACVYNCSFGGREVEKDLLDNMLKGLGGAFATRKPNRLFI